jgi:hypothetical protein
MSIRVLPVLAAGGNEAFASEAGGAGQDVGDVADVEGIVVSTRTSTAVAAATVRYSGHRLR